MHGTILVLLKRYVTHTYDFAAWHRLVELSGLPETDFETMHVYPDAHLYKLLTTAAEQIGLPAEELLEKFGEFLVPDLLFMYRKLLDPAWHTLDMLEHVEERMHGAVRRDMHGASPPVLHVERLSPTTVRVHYVSPRRMSALAVGIVRGLARYYGEEDHLRITPRAYDDGDRVEILVERVARALSDADAPPAPRL